MTGNPDRKVATVKTNPMIDRIIAGEICDSEINIHNADRIMRWVKDTDRHHTAETCNSQKKKDCVHAPGAHVVDWAAALVSEATFICTCGAHGVDNPGEAARVINTFITRWNS